MKISLLLVLALGIGISNAYGAQRWEDTEELYSACSQDPSPSCKERLIQKCGPTPTVSAKTCARRNAKKLFNDQWRENVCGKPCGGDDPGNFCKNAKAKFHCK